MDYSTAKTIIAGALADGPENLTDDRRVELGNAFAFVMIDIAASLNLIAQSVRSIDLHGGS